MSRKLLAAFSLCLVLPACSTVSQTIDRINIFKPSKSVAEDADAATVAFQQFARFTGDWACTVDEQTDSGWARAAGSHHWSWYPIMGGRAMQDVWESRNAAGATRMQGTNVRIWNTERERWEIAWTSSAQQEWDLIWAEQVNADMVMHMRRPKRGSYDAHVARMSFYNIGEESFDWKYESAPLTDARNYRETSRIHCVRD